MYFLSRGEHACTSLPLWVLVLTETNKHAAEWALSFLCDMLVLHPFISLFFIGACLLLARYLPNWGTAIVSIGLTVPVLIIFMSLLVRATSGRTQSHTR